MGLCRFLTSEIVANLELALNYEVDVLRVGKARVEVCAIQHLEDLAVILNFLKNFSEFTVKFDRLFESLEEQLLYQLLFLFLGTLKQIFIDGEVQS